ncbi:16677_t:CDS:2 [Funneliformis geosporum]|uniref:19650_t:CDS:1 n=1 Tax=Funneliformis geosporum TaxID=1117311 RepID=A0A9W4WT46_9GLOM|nr:16677_t:CDS:2 [Funneliformis geosporum]CAI2170135.1 19650_t:CDS:2 [Funneliformis geosporum]
MGIVKEIKHRVRTSLKLYKSKRGSTIDLRNLPIDCLERIFQYIYTDTSNDNIVSSTITNLNSLFMCAQVNKLWCALSIPVLWRRPFSVALDGKKNAQLINTIISFLSEQEKNILRYQQLKFDSFMTHKFNYLQLIKVLDYDNFIKSVHRWVVRYPNDCKDFTKSRVLTQLLGKVLLKENALSGFKTFNYFRVRTYDNFDFIPLNKLNPQNSFDWLSQLTQLEYRNPHRVNKMNLNEFLDFFSIITSNCNQINNLSLDVRIDDMEVDPSISKLLLNEHDYMKIDHSISELLLSQHRLENLSINFTSKTIYNSIYKHVNSLSYLHIKKMNDVSDLLRIITSCKVLHTLELEQSSNDNFVRDSFIANFPLSQLSIKHFYFNFDKENYELFLMMILEMINSNLTTFSTKLITPNILQILSSYCTNITSLNVANILQNINFKSLLDFITILPLRQLYLELPYSHFQENMFEISNLASSLPTSLECIHLKCFISPQHLSDLLNESQSRIRSLWLYHVDDNYVEYLKILYKYSHEHDSCLKDVKLGWNNLVNHRCRRKNRSWSGSDDEFQRTMSKRLRDAKNSQKIVISVIMKIFSKGN